MTSIERKTFRSRMISPVRFSASSTQLLKHIPSQSKRLDNGQLTNDSNINRKFRSRNIKSVKKTPINPVYKTQPVKIQDVQDSLGWKESAVFQQKIRKTMKPIQFYKEFIQPMKIKKRRNPQISSITQILDQLQKQTD